MSRLSRKQMKRDEVLEGAARLVHVIQEHGRAIAAGLAIVAVAAVAIAVWFALAGRKESAANEALAKALVVYRAGIDVASPRPDDPNAPTFGSELERMDAARAAFEAVRDEYGSSKVASVAAGYLAEIAARRGDQDEARELWRNTAKDAKTALEIGHWVNRLALDRAAGRAEEVRAELEAMLGDGGSNVPIPVVLDQLAETLLALDRRDEAREIYQRIVDEHPGSAYSIRASAALRPNAP